MGDPPVCLIGQLLACKIAAVDFPGDGRSESYWTSLTFAPPKRHDLANSQIMIMREDGTAADALASQVITPSLWQCACRPFVMRVLRTAECRPSALKLRWNR
jgi:hypothetical protein